jgi:hypothetical protein
VYASQVGARNKNFALTVNGFWADNEVATGTAINHVRLEAIATHIKMLYEAFLNGSVIHECGYT